MTASSSSKGRPPQTLTVGSLDDTTGASDCLTPTNTDCTLRQAIIDANTNSGADTILFRSGLSGDINLTSDPEQIIEAVAIHGPGASQITVDGMDAYRTFNIDPVAGNDPVSISGLRLSSGYTTNRGGGIYNYDADLTISNSVIADNNAAGNTRGGGLYSYTGDVTINSSTISGNYVGGPTTTGQGGGVFAYRGDVTVTNSTVSGNTAANYSASYYGAYGGGINAEDGNINVDGSTFSDNKARDGGGIYSSSGNVSVANSTITGNKAVSDDGGGVWVSDGTLLVTGSTVTDNHADT